MVRRSGLGRGLGALIPPDASTRVGDTALQEVPLALIRPDQYVAWRGSRAVDPDRVIAILRGAHREEALTSELRERTA